MISQYLLSFQKIFFIFHLFFLLLFTFHSIVLLFFCLFIYFIIINLPKRILYETINIHKQFYTIVVIVYCIFFFLLNLFFLFFPTFCLFYCSKKKSFVNKHFYVKLYTYVCAYMGKFKTINSGGRNSNTPKLQYFFKILFMYNHKKKKRYFG